MFTAINPAVSYVETNCVFALHGASRLLLLLLLLLLPANGMPCAVIDFFLTSRTVFTMLGNIIVVDELTGMLDGSRDNVSGSTFVPILVC